MNEPNRAEMNRMENQNKTAEKRAPAESKQVSSSDDESGINVTPGRIDCRPRSGVWLPPR